ncbi:Lrp/AsnC family transcriptional regulator [Myxosarcina sp. GI1]|uniref:Lrp/AsnC family transcriptional regulator n=1 Tax=Myxosarcina sp. GI1 TaxID=1541065 RepID=UPI00209C93F5|nr:Lrp/AsnC family transcriptional regulator [Myxosarcina sp. GI1]
MRNLELDRLDRDIINLLRVDGRMSFREIAQHLDIPEATARYRVQRLLSSEIIKILAWPNPALTGNANFIIVWLTVKNTCVETVAETLSQFEEVRFVAITAGRYNIVVDVYFGEHEQLFAFFQQLHEIPGIIKYESQTILKLLKAEYKYTLS